MIGHADANEIKSDTAIGDDEDATDNIEKLSQYPTAYIVTTSFLVGMLVGAGMAVLIYLGTLAIK